MSFGVFTFAQDPFASEGVLNASATATGLAATGAIGSVGVVAGANIPVTPPGQRVPGAGGVGSVTVIADANVPELGLVGTGAVGTVSHSTETVLIMTGLVGTGAIGSVTVIADANVPELGLVGTGAIGSVGVVADSNVIPTGVPGTGAVGSVTLSIDTVFTVTGVQATSAVGTATASADAGVPVIGLEVLGSVGGVLVWGTIVPSQDPEYQELSPTQEPSYTQITASQTPGYTELSPTQEPEYTEITPSYEQGQTWNDIAAQERSMPSYSERLRLELMTTGEFSGQWGDRTNVNIGSILEQAVAGVKVINFATDADRTLVTATGNAASAGGTDYTDDEAHFAVLSLTTSSNLTTTRNLIIPAEEKVYIVKNGTGGAQTVNIKTTSGTSVPIRSGKTITVFCDGTNCASTLDDLPSGTTVGGADIVTALAAQSISAKTITSSTVNSSPVGNTGTSTGAFTTLTSSSTTTLDGTTIPTSKTLVDTNSSQTLTNKTLGSSSAFDASTGTAPFTVDSTTKVTNLNADTVDGKTAPSGTIVGTSDTQTLSNKTISSPVINEIIHEGTDDAYETTIAFTDPTADRTITFPDNSGTVALAAAIPSNPAIVDNSGTPVLATGITADEVRTLINASSSAGEPTGDVVGTTDTQTIQNKTLTSTTAFNASTGTAPFTVASTTEVANLHADTATTLTTARNIAGNSFDGSASITIAPSDLSALTASRALLSNGSGLIDVSAVTSTELGYLDGVSSSIQTQLGGKQATITGAATTIDDTDLTVNRAVVSNGSGKIAVSAVTSTELGYLDGVSSSIQTQLGGKQAIVSGVSSTEIGYLDGVSSSIQTQIDGKASSDGGVFTNVDINSGNIDGVIMGGITPVSSLNVGDIRFVSNVMYSNADIGGTSNLIISPVGAGKVTIDSTNTSAGAPPIGLEITDGNLVLIDGNLVVASGHGIDFSATSDGSGVDTSELLDDYEEGTWSPSFSAASTSLTTQPTFSNAKYTRVGRSVTVSCNIIGIASNGDALSDLRLNGLPYSVSSAGSFAGAIKAVRWDNVKSPLVCEAFDNTSYILFYYYDSTLGHTINKGNSLQTAGTANNQTSLTLTYFV